MQVLEMDQTWFGQQLILAKIFLQLKEKMTRLRSIKIYKNIKYSIQVFKLKEYLVEDY